MDEKKQIDEIFKDINEIFDKEYSERKLITAYHTAKELYAAGYRKHSEGEWVSKIVNRCDWKGREQSYYQPNSCSNCHEAVTWRTPFCPFCGAKMKGV